MSQPNIDPKEIYGEDLSAVLGPKAERKSIRRLTFKQRQFILSKIPKYVSTDVLGEDPTLYQVVNLVLSVLKRSRALRGIDLPFFTTEMLKELGLQRPDEMYKSVEKICKNNKVQRGIQLQHLVGDILFNFNPEWVLCGLARYSKEQDKYYLNDAQHRYVACVILGIRAIPLEYKISELRSDDVWQYSAVNLRSLVASEFDKYRSMVQAVDSLIEENPNLDMETLDTGFVNAWTIRNILQRYGAEMIETGGGKVGALQCTGAYNMTRHFNDYHADIFERAVAIHTEVFNKTAIASPNIWGICEFIKIQEDANVLSNKFELDEAIKDALLHRYPDGTRVGFHLEVKRAFKEGKLADLKVNEETQLAAGIHKLITITNPDVNWEPIKHNGVVVADAGLKSFKVPPVFQAA